MKAYHPGLSCLPACHADDRRHLPLTGEQDREHLTLLARQRQMLRQALA
jgi:hypothetical protein